MTPGSVAAGPAKHLALPLPAAVRALSYDVASLMAMMPPSTGAPARESDGHAAKTPPDSLLMRLKEALRPPLAALEAPNGTLDWPAAFRPFQRDGIAALLARREVLLADDMGLGKTVQAIAALRILFHRREAASALVVCPASLLTQWRRELARWAPDMVVVTVAGTPAQRGMLWRRPAHIRLVGYETLRSDVMGSGDSAPLRVRWDVVVLDEASRIKNREADVSAACKRLPRERRWAMTGTPLENGVDDLISLFEFLHGSPGARAERGRPWQTAGGAVTHLRSVQLRRRKEDVLHELPPKQVNEVALELGPAQRAAYDRAEREGVVRLTALGAAVSVTHVLELITRLKQICNRDVVSGEAVKMEDIARRMRALAASGHRALVFSQFTDDVFGVGRLAVALQEFNPLVFTGSMTGRERESVVDSFQRNSRHKALLLSLRAGGVGLNLQAASYVFHLDRWWNPAIEEQADARAHRMGQPEAVTVYRYVCANTIEERIDAKLREKRQLFANTVDEAAGDVPTTLTEAEIFGLFGLG